jgi:hypothetical protein
MTAIVLQDTMNEDTGIEREEVTDTTGGIEEEIMIANGTATDTDEMMNVVLLGMMVRIDVPTEGAVTVKTDLLVLEGRTRMLWQLTLLLLRVTAVGENVGEAKIAKTVWAHLSVGALLPQTRFPSL